MAKIKAGSALWVKVDEQSSNAGASAAIGKIDAGGGFSYPAFDAVTSNSFQITILIGNARCRGMLAQRDDKGGSAPLIVGTVSSPMGEAEYEWTAN